MTITVQKTSITKNENSDYLQIFMISRGRTAYVVLYVYHINEWYQRYFEVLRLMQIAAHILIVDRKENYP